MSTETTEVTQVTTQPSTEAVSTQIKAPEVSATPNTPTTPVEPAYQPNYKFKVLDKEQEFDEYLRPVIKDPETEKKVRELYERAHGIDFVKQQRDKIRAEYQQVKSSHDPLVQELSQVGKFLQNKDFNSFFGKFNIPKEAIVQWVADELNYQQLPQDQRQKLEAARSVQERAYTLEQENATLKQQYEQHQVATLDSQIKQVMAHPQVVEAQAKFDERFGQQGAFQDEIIRRGDYYYKTTGKLVPPDQIAVEVMKMSGLWNETPSQSAAPTQPAAPQVVEAPQAKPVIKNVAAKSSGASPVKKQMKSIEELRERYKTMSQP